MGQAKKDLAEQEASKDRQRAAMKGKGYSFCQRCELPFKAKDGELLCEECWDEVTKG
ncbi:hypothetical protein [Bacillus inaquosorum]|uniref:hypothetical protein n=1 Tax=Bacillus inaquosorum TaxID=483913 RepID=UPI00227F38D0|nr:hypothetical protein [Bacillus inaquosorum]MCY7766679.1 hypothetical protein [Bacillus inaquosorum]